MSGGAGWSEGPVLVIGGAGFGGAHLCELLLAGGAKVHVADRAQGGASFFRLAGLERRCDFTSLDLGDVEAVKLLIARLEPAWVFLLAAQPIVSVSNALPLETARVNILGVYHVLEACRLSRVRPRLIFASSGAYYGATVTEEAILEDAAPLPSGNIYASTKVAADIAVRSYARIYGLRTVVCRWMNTYGPGDTHFSRIIPVTLRRLLRGERAQIDGTDGSNVLELLHVRDMAEGYLAAARQVDRPGVCGEAFNFGSGQPLSLREVLVRVARAWNKTGGPMVPEEPLITGPAVRSVKYLDITKARERLGWSPRTDLDTGLEETILWYREHRAALGI
jgi:nucleoside-diphosphate-sugar epimerase